MVLECQRHNTAVPKRWYWLWIPMDGFNILVELQLKLYSTLFQSLLDNFLLIWRKEDVPPSAPEVLVASEVADKKGHELGILLRIHAFLKIGESFGKTHGLAAGIVRTSFLLGTERGVNQIEVGSHFIATAECQLAKTGFGLRTVGMQAERISCRYVWGEFCVFIHFLFLFLLYNHL